MNILKLFATLISICVGFTLSVSVYAYQPDAAYLTVEKKNAKKWAAQNVIIQQKLQELYRKHNKRPNIIFILTDDIGWGELGSYLGGKLRGTPTPNLDKMAKDGMQFLSAYAEPSCTPTRIAVMTGRIPVRTGLNVVLWPGQKDGLSPKEVTIAELLSRGGYHTAMWGKWHLGELQKHAPENQGFDYAYYSLYNGAAWAWPDMQKFYERQVVPGVGFFYDYPGNKKYLQQYGIRIEGIYKGIKGKGRKEVAPIGSQAMVDFERDSANQIIQYIKDKAKSDKPFFIYWASFANQVAGSPNEYRFKKGVDSRNNQAAQLLQHDVSVGKILKTLKEQGIAGNTIVIWYSDNGPMYAFWPTSGYSWLKGGKGQVTEGGVRVPAIAYWPGTIKSGQTPIGLIHITDLFTTMAKLGGVKNKIPSDRVTDGIDQTAFLILGEGNSRRYYIFHYSGAVLGALRIGDYKAHFSTTPSGGLPHMKVYNIARDPKETHGSMYNYLWLVTPIENVLKLHRALIKKFPHRKPEVEE